MDTSRYFQTLIRKLRLDPGVNQEIVLELQSHLDDKVRDLQEEGLTYEEARERSLRDLGQPEAIARGMYSVHSKASWRDIIIATLPHLLLASLFALHLWTKYILLAVVLAGISFIALKAWRSGRPKWTYTWLGYSMAAPILSWMLALTAVGYGAWVFVTTGSLPFSFPIYILLVAYVPFSLWIMHRVIARVVRQDWLLASLTALPFPFLTSWLLFLNWQGGLWSTDNPQVHETDTDRALVFLALAVTTGVFMKVGHRLIKIGLLTLATALIVTFTVSAIPVSIGAFSMILIIIASIAFLFTPAYLESRLKRRDALSEANANPARGSESGEAVTHWFSNTQ